MFVSAEKEREMFIISPDFVRCCPRDFKLGQAECVQTMKAWTTQPRDQLFLMQSLYLTPKQVVCSVTYVTLCE